MMQKIIPLDGIRKININLVQGDLQIIGWERPEMTAKCDQDALSIHSHEDEIDLDCEDDLALYVSSVIEVNVMEVEGDCDIRAMDGNFHLLHLGGDCQLRNVGSVQIDDLDGDLSVRNCSKGIKVLRGSGDASLKDIGGDVHLDLDGDLTLRGLEGSLWARAMGDAALNLRPAAESNIYVIAEGDVLLTLPARLEATLNLKSDNEGDIRVDMPGATPVEPGDVRKVVLGSGQVPVTVEAGGELIVTSRDDPAGYSGPGVNMSGIPADLDERIHRITEEAAQKAMEASAAAGGLSELIQARVERAMRKVEEKMKSAEQRARHSGVGIRPGQRSAVNTAAAGSGTAPSQPVGETERMAILKMLQEKKISAAEAEVLLNALEGKG